MWIKKKDKVLVLSGKYKGKRAEVLSTAGKEKFIVSKINVVKKHQKPSQGAAGGIIEKELPIHQSKLMLVCPSCDEAVRININISEDGSKTRVCKQCREVIS